jgi:hypothetical protein
MSFVVTQDNETLTATATGGDADETAVVSATFSSTPSNKYTPDQKAAYAKLSAALNTRAAGAATIGAVATLAPDPSISKFFAGTMFTLSGLYWLGSAHYNTLSLDPPDSNFKAIARPAPAATSASAHGRAEVTN